MKTKSIPKRPLKKVLLSDKQLKMIKGGSDEEYYEEEEVSQGK